MSRQKDAGQNHNTNTDNKPIKNAAQVTHLETRLENQNYTDK
jgi:hypothetical protein